MTLIGHHTFPPSSRLRRAEEFTRVFRQGVRSSDGFFTSLARPNSGDAARLGLAISKKVARNAVDRNRIKRVVREAFRLNATTLPAMDIVVMAKQGAVGGDSAELTASLITHWKRLAERCVESASS